MKTKLIIEGIEHAVEGGNVVFLTSSYNVENLMDDICSIMDVIDLDFSYDRTHDKIDIETSEKSYDYAPSILVVDYKTFTHKTNTATKVFFDETFEMTKEIKIGINCIHRPFRTSNRILLDNIKVTKNNDFCNTLIIRDENSNDSITIQPKHFKDFYNFIKQTIGE